MSQRTVCSFFPAHCTHIWKPRLSWFYSILYPDDVVDTCPERVINVTAGSSGIITVRNPFLALYALAGIVIGLGWSLKILRRTNIWSDPWSCRYVATIVRNNANFYWFVAFLFFGLMNVSGLFLHCLRPYPAEVRDYSVGRSVYWLCDTFSTGVFGMSLWAGAMMESVHRQLLTKNTDAITDIITYGWVVCKQQLTKNTDAIRDIITYGWVVGNTFGVFAIVSYFVGRGNPEAKFATFPLELWYLLPPVAFGSSGIIFMLVCNFTKQLAVCCAASFLIFCVAALDPLICRNFGYVHLDMLAQPSLMFAGTDVAFLGIGLWLDRKYALNEIKRKQR